MKENIVSSKISEAKTAIDRFGKDLEAINELEAALKTHTGKLVDKRFFEKHFTISNEYRNWTKYNLLPPAYDWSKYNHRLYISQSVSLELQTRETIEILEALKLEREKIETWIKDRQARIVELSSINEKQLIRDLQAVYKKHGKPSIWGAVLDTFEVKYPSK